MRVHLTTYFGDVYHVVQPPEQITPAIMVNLERCRHRHIREYEGGRTMILGPGYGTLHHLSYVRSDAAMDEKLAATSHRDELLRGWKTNVYNSWVRDKTLRELHPTHPRCFLFTERVDPPDILKGAHNPGPPPGDPPLPANWPTVSVVIPVYGGREMLRRLLESIAPLCDEREGSLPLIHEVIVVDDCSPASPKKPTSAFA